MDILEKINSLIRKLERVTSKTISQKYVLDELEKIADLYLKLDFLVKDEKSIGDKIWNISQNQKLPKKKVMFLLRSAKKNLSSYETKNKLKNNILKPGKILFFTSSQNYSAYYRLKEIFSSAKNNIDVIDPYLYPQTFSILKSVDKKIKIRLISAPMGFYRGSKTDFNNFKKEYYIEARESKIIHDRFFIIDNVGYFSGSSIHNVGNKLSAIALHG